MSTVKSMVVPWQEFKSNFRRILTTHRRLASSGSSAAFVSKERLLGSPTRVLLVVRPYAMEIVCGLKVWELRSTDTNVRERIAIALAGTKTILGEVSLVDSFKVDAAMLRNNFDKHRVPQSEMEKFIRAGSGFAWVLERPRKYDFAKPYCHAQGAVKWVHIRPENAPCLTLLVVIVISHSECRFHFQPFCLQLFLSAVLPNFF